MVIFVSRLITTLTRNETMVPKEAKWWLNLFVFGEKFVCTYWAELKLSIILLMALNNSASAISVTGGYLHL